MQFWNLQKRSFGLLPPRNRRKFMAAIIIQSSLGILDVVGVLLTGVIGALATFSYSNSDTPMQITRVLEMLNLEDEDPATAIMILSLIALTFFLAKTGLSLFFTRKTFRFLAKHQSQISSALVKKILHSEYAWVRDQEPHALSTNLIVGVSAATSNALAQIIVLSAEFFLLGLFVCLLLVINPAIAIFMILYMAVVLAALNYLVMSKVAISNQHQSELRLESERDFYNALRLFREIRVLNRSNWFETKFQKNFGRQANYYAMDIWMQQIPKYALEVALLVGAAGLLVAGKISSNSAGIIPILIIYLASSARIFPSLTRIQSSMFSIKSHSFYGDAALSLIEEFQRKEIKSSREPRDIPANTSIENSSDIELNRVSFRFPDSEEDVLSELSFEIETGERVAIVGASGSGKSTLCDIFLGLLEPTTGKIEIGNQIAEKWIRGNIGSISYLPQDVTLIGGTVIDNICIGLSDFEIDQERVADTILQAQLGEFVKLLPDGIHTDLGKNGIKISGGQKQRIGIARALYSKPSILILDEATSALDAETENGIMSVLESLGDTVTLIFIAHRLSSIRNFKRVLYFEGGKLLADGSFEEVRAKIPNFNLQAKLLGL